MGTKEFLSKAKNNVKKSVESEINDFKSNPVPYLKGGLAVAITSLVAWGITDIYEDKTSIAIVEVPHSYAEEHTEIYLSDLEEKIFTGTVTVIDKNGETEEIDPTTLMIKSPKISKYEFKKYDAIYKISQECSLKNKNLKKTKCMLAPGEYVLGKAESNNDGYLKVMTTNGKIIGMVAENNLTKIMETSILEEKNKEKNKEKYSGSSQLGYTAINGEVFGIDCTNKSIEYDTLNSVLAGTKQLKGVGEITNPQVDYAIFRIAAYGWGKHKLALDENETEDDRISKIVEQVKLALDNDVPYGLYLYSTCVNTEEAKEEARFLSKVLDKIKEETGTLPFIPVGIDVELEGGTQNRQYKAAQEDKNSVSLAKATLFEELIKKYPDTDFMLYTERNASEVKETKFFDVETIVDNVKGMDQLDVWWVAAMNKGEAAEKLHANSAKSFERESNGKAKIVMKQVALDVEPGIDMNVTDEDWIIPYFKEFAKWNKSHDPQVASIRNEANQLNFAYMTAFTAPLYSYDGKHVKCMLDVGAQLLGKGVPDKNGYVSVVTRDGKSGKIDISRLTKVNRRVPEVQIKSTINNSEEGIEI